MPREKKRVGVTRPKLPIYPFYAYVARTGRGIQKTYGEAHAFVQRSGGGITVGFESEREAREFVLNGTVMYNDIHGHSQGKLSLRSEDVTTVHMEVKTETDPRSQKTYHVLRAWTKPLEPAHPGNLTSILRIPPPVSHARLLLYAAYLVVDTFKDAERPVVVFRDVLLYRILKENALRFGKDTSAMAERLARVKHRVCWVYVPDLASVNEAARKNRSMGGQQPPTQQHVQKENPSVKDERYVDDSGGQPTDPGGDHGGGGTEAVGGQAPAVHEGGPGPRAPDLHADPGGLPVE